MFLRLPSKDVGDVALQKICSRSTMMNLFLGLALEDEIVSEIVIGR